MLLPHSGRSAPHHGYGFAGGPVSDPDVVREVEKLQSELYKQEQRAAELKQKRYEKAQNDLLRTEHNAANIRYRMQTEQLNGPGSLNPFPTNPALLHAPGAYAPRPLLPHQMPKMSQQTHQMSQQTHQMDMPNGPNALPSLPPEVIRPQAPQKEKLPEPEEDFDLPLDDPDTRHQAVTERCVYLYLKGRLEGFDILRPEFVFDAIDERYDHAGFFSSASLRASHRRGNRELGDADLWGAAQEAQERAAIANRRRGQQDALRELYHEAARRMDDPSNSTGPARPGDTVSQHRGVVGGEPCTKCGKNLASDARFCNSCGEPRPPKECTICGNPFAPGAAYCRKCGAARATAKSSDATPGMTTLSEIARPGDTTLHVGNSHGFKNGDEIIIGGQETKRIVSFGPLRLDTALKYGHGLGTEVKKATNSTPGFNPSSPTGGFTGSHSAQHTVGQSSSGSDAHSQQLQKLEFYDREGHPMRYEKHTALDPSRRKAFVTKFPQCVEPAQVYEIVARGAATGQTVQMREFTAVIKGGPVPTASSAAELVRGFCEATQANLTPSECIEYEFGDEQNVWRLASLSKEALADYRKSKFRLWYKMLQEPECEAQFNKMVQIGPVTHVFDARVFPTSDALKKNYQVVNEKTGRVIDIPHPVSRLRVWNVGKQAYDALDAQLDGAPSAAQKDTWWQAEQKNLGKTQNKLKSALKQPASSGSGALPPNGQQASAQSGAWPTSGSDQFAWPTSGQQSGGDPSGAWPSSGHQSSGDPFGAWPSSTHQSSGDPFGAWPSSGHQSSGDPFGDWTKSGQQSNDPFGAWPSSGQQSSGQSGGHKHSSGQPGGHKSAGETMSSWAQSAADTGSSWAHSVADAFHAHTPQAHSPQAGSPKASEVVVQFVPGELGFDANWKKGEVTKIHPGTQAAKNGIKVGWKILKVNAYGFTEEYLDKCLDKGKPFEMTFATNSTR